MYRKLLLLMVFLIFGCSSTENFLQGSWVYDGERTLAELETRENVPSSLMKCYKNRICGFQEMNMLITENSWQMDFKGYKGAGPQQYNYETVSKNEINFMPVNRGKNEFYRVVKASNESIYFELSSSNFTYREYYKRN